MNQAKLRINKYRTKETTRQMIERFDCGNIKINNYLQNDALTVQVAKTFVMTVGNQIAGFFSICADAVKNSEESRNNAILAPAIRIHMFAIDNRFKHKRIKLSNSEEITYAHFMLEDCINRIKNLVNNEIGAELITVNSTQEGLLLYTNSGKFELADSFEGELLTSPDDEKLTPLIRLIFEEEFSE